MTKLSVAAFLTAAFILSSCGADRLPMLVHLWTDPTYEQEGAEHATVFLNRILPAAPDLVVQIAHLSDGGCITEAAFEVFADAIAATLREAWQPRETAIELPAELAQVLRERERISGNN